MRPLASSFAPPLPSPLPMPEFIFFGFSEAVHQSRQYRRDFEDYPLDDG